MYNLLNKKGTYIITAAWLITMALWIFTSNDIVGQFNRLPIYTVAKGLALTAVTLLSFQYLLATRAHFLEWMFGGLDNVYATHHKLGMLAFFFIILHPFGIYLSGIVTNLPTTNIYVFHSTEMAFNFGILALYTYIGLLVCTLFLTLPYRIWRLTHIFMFVPFILVGIHVLFLMASTTLPQQNDLAYSLPLSIWILGLIAFGIFCALYKRFFYWYLSKQYQYRVTQIQTMGEIEEIYLEAVKDHAQFRPGQFVFAKFPNNKAIGNELHPFSLSSSPDLATLRLSIKKEGKFTKSLASLKINDLALLYGPYGAFSEKYLITKKEMVWIAGGIGVTPFLSMLAYESEHLSGRKIHFYYSTSTKEEAVYDGEISKFAVTIPELNYQNYISKTNGHLSVDIIKADLNGDLKNKIYFICGPRPMMASFERDLLKAGIKNYNIVYEDFSIFVD